MYPKEEERTGQFNYSADWEHCADILLEEFRVVNSELKTREAARGDDNHICELSMDANNEVLT